MTDYQEDDDEAHVIRVDSEWPTGVKPLAAADEWVSVAGISRCEDAARAFVASRERLVLLEREPGNAHDPNAVRVVGFWRAHDGYADGARLGYLPRDVAADLAESAADQYLHARLVALYAPRPGKGYGIRIAIGVSSTVDPRKVETGLRPRPSRTGPREVLPERHKRASPGAKAALWGTIVLLALFLFLMLRR